ncbi:NAD(P)-binding protein [Mycena rebaudengoi]|nr:NAD(P)-binding protein [Mycena rebaudengoi]
MSSKGIALVTGAAQGIGRGIALRLADDGFDVAVNDVSNNAGKLDQLVNEIKAKGRASSKHIADVSVDEQVREMVEQVVQLLGGLDVMVANAGIVTPAQAMVETPTENWDRIMAVNARGPFLCYKYAAAQMVKQGRGGRIIGASSVAGKQAMARIAAYSASKFAVRGLTQAAALELGPHGINVNAYAPGVIDTPMLGAGIPNGDPSSLIDKFTNNSPLKRIGTPDDIAGLVSFLVSKESQFITGQTVSINGGIALVPGAARGKGKAIALRLADEGFDVVVNDVAGNAGKLDQLVDIIKAKGRTNSTHIASSVDEQVREMVEHVVQQLGGLDVSPAENWDRITTVNARGAFLCYKYAAAQMIKQGRGGKVIGASSFVGKQGTAHVAAYSASKFAVRGLTQAAALEQGPHDINVNAYAPGAIDTPLLGASIPNGDPSALINKAIISAFGNWTPDDIASLVSFLVSKESQFITATTPISLFSSSHILVVRRTRRMSLSAQSPVLTALAAALATLRPPTSRAGRRRVLRDFRRLVARKWPRAP